MLEVVSVVIDMVNVRDILFLKVGVEILADSHQAVFIAHGYPEQLQHLCGFYRIRDQYFRRSRVRRGRETADPRKGVEIAEAEVERLSAAHGKSRQRAMLAVGVNGIVRFDKRYDVLEQVGLEILSPTVAAHGGRVATTTTTTTTTTPPAARGIGCCVAVWKDNHHG